MKRIIRTAVIGYGNRGRYLAGNYSRAEHAGFELTGICDVDPARLAMARKVFGDQAAYTSSVDELLARRDIDAIIVATHDHQHLEPTLAALRAGKHVICEKPLCQTAEDARRVVQEVRRAGKVFMIGFELRQCVVFQTMRRLIDEGRIGEVKVAHVFDNVSVGGSDGFLRDEFYRRIVENAPSEDALHSAYYSTALAACAEESIETGLPVAIPPMA